MVRVTAVVVAWNRRDLLREALEALEAQTRPVDDIVVVDNASDDDSSDVARAASPRANVIRLERNTGGAGGFAVGIADAIGTHGADLVWIMDDDTVPTETALAELLAARQAVGSAASVYASRVVWHDGTDHPMNTPRRDPFASRKARARIEGLGLVPVRSASFVSLLVDAAVVRERGLPIADYFIWNDDFEYSTRLIRGRLGVYCPGSVVVHKTKVLGSTDADPGPRFYYEVRNKLWLFRFSDGLTAWEKLVYGGSTVRRWMRTVRRSAEPGVLREARARGWRDGTRSAPRPNGASMADLPPAVDAITAFASRGGRV
ncbi:glycosyltransferase family 2 protein [Protaetiibacter sp. SSC-01]|uniref:glycosyltransferase family 2 protein n=1 Tax=Protaetiibacter sp. SSC-01 TaxID=2759943 RepID=UPI001656CF81|nr:glycosyltransferase family 2 protein [Protaetiibacter sp. SSC-01]QNO37047.1 glycosyltransferase family 2 protein [Protaetiibacter sp. SSC-01]